MKTILAAEDDEAIRQILTMALGSVPGWSVTALPTGDELLQQAAISRPDLILLDLHLPGVDNSAIYRLLRERDEMREVPVLLLNAEPKQVQHAGLEGSVAVLGKPLRIDALIVRAAELLGDPVPNT